VDDPVAHLRRDPLPGPVVAEEHEQGVVAHPVLLQPGHQFADQLVQIGDVVGEVLLVVVDGLPLRLRVPVGAVRGRLVGGVGEHHRVVQEERVTLVPGDEVDGPVAHQVGAVLAVRVVEFLAVDLQSGVGVPGRPAGELPEAVLVEPEVLGPVEPAAELPLAGDPRRVPGLLEEVGEGDRVRLEPAEPGVVADVVLPGHELHPGRGAQRLDVAVLEPHPAGGQPVQVRRLVRGAAVTPQALVPEVVGQDEHDVRPVRRRERGGEGGGREGEKEADHFGSFFLGRGSGRARSVFSPSSP
jgi:hypothetical protein